MIVRVLVEMRVIWEMVEASNEKMKANLGQVEAWLGKTEAKTRTGQEQMEAEIKTDLEEMNATESEANQEKLEAMAEHCNWTPHIKATHSLTALQVRASDAVCRALKGRTFKKRGRTYPECNNGIRG
jgi:hypothetical protein